MPVRELPYAAGRDDDDLPPPDRPKTAALRTTHMQLMQGEIKKFSATRTKGCGGCSQEEVRATASKTCQY